MNSYHGVTGDCRIGMPTVHLEVDFRAISRMGDQVWLSLDSHSWGLACGDRTRSFLRDGICVTIAAPRILLGVTAED